MLIEVLRMVEWWISTSFDHDGFTWQYGGGSSNEWWNDGGKNLLVIWFEKQVGV